MTEAASKRRVVIAGGSGTLGSALAELLRPDFDVLQLTTRADAPANQWACDLTSLAETEIALSGAHIVVYLARAAADHARLLQASMSDVDAVMADSVSKAVQKTNPERVVFFACGEADAREAILKASGIPLSILRGGGSNPVAALAELVRADSATTRQLEPWSAPDDERHRGSKPTQLVCSIQRYPRPPGASAKDIAAAYFEWLTTRPLVRVERVETTWNVFTGGMRILALREARYQSDPRCFTLDVVGGALATTSGKLGRFEFRLLAGDNEAVAILTGFVPSLPWPIYRTTQAIAHGRTMRAFGRSLESRSFTQKAS